MMYDVSKQIGDLTPEQLEALAAYVRKVLAEKEEEAAAAPLVEQPRQPKRDVRPPMYDVRHVPPPQQRPQPQRPQPQYGPVPQPEPRPSLLSEEIRLFLFVLCVVMIFYTIAAVLWMPPQFGQVGYWSGMAIVMGLTAYAKARRLLGGKNNVR